MKLEEFSSGFLLMGQYNIWYKNSLFIQLVISM